MQYYPFLTSEKDRLRSIGVKLDEIPEHPVYSVALENAAKSIEGDGEEPEDRDFAIVEFTLEKILLSILDDRKVSESYAERKSDEYREALEKESLTYLIKVAREDFGMDLKTEDSLRLDFIDFLKNKPDFLKLSQMNMLKGYVQVTKRQLAWILKGAIKNRILDSIPEKQKFPEGIEKVAKRLKGKTFVARKRPERPSIERLTERALPPCMQDIISALEAGTANHNAHFVMVTFLHGLKLDEDSILEVFRRSPKFKEKTARYQVRFSKERGYTCPACKSIKEYGLCPADCPRGHPVSNYFLFLKNPSAHPRAQDKKT